MCYGQRVHGRRAFGLESDKDEHGQQHVDSQRNGASCTVWSSGLHRIDAVVGGPKRVGSGDFSTIGNIDSGIWRRAFANPLRGHKDRSRRQHSSTVLRSFARAR
jgi:hypothetical protein